MGEYQVTSDNLQSRYRKKLIETALPLKKINEESAWEKSIRHGHPSTLHLWWARRPLAACRAVLFTQLVNDLPLIRRTEILGSVDEERASLKRAELFNRIKELVCWENTNNPRVVERARAEIFRCAASRKIELCELQKDTIVFDPEEGKKHPDGPLPNDGRFTAWQVNCRLASAKAVNHFLSEYAPPVLDPFAGGGSIPLEAQRLGLRAHASDLNPVAVLINKALIEIPPRFAGMEPVYPAAGSGEQGAGSRKQGPRDQEMFPRKWQGARGLAEDVKYYGQWMRDKTEKRIGHLYPKVAVIQETGNWIGQLIYPVESIETAPAIGVGHVRQSSATIVPTYSKEIISTDPPYYDNIGYADLSDFFYVWLRRSLKDVYQNLLSTMLTPKAEEMIASPYRHDGSRAKAAAFFEKGLGSAIGQWRKYGHGDYSTTIFYAFKQAETTTEGTASTGWETFLTGVIDHGFVITGTWPMRTELTVNLKKNVAALASSAVLACVPRAADASMATRREFLNQLERELPYALRLLQSGNIAPVDLSQAAIGPGMTGFSRYAKVIEADGSSMTVRTALTLINQILDEVLAEPEGEFDAATRWAVAWFEQYGVQEGPYGIVNSRSGSVQLFDRSTLPAEWDPVADKRLTAWEATQHLIRALDQAGESGAAELLRKLGGDFADKARDLAYQLYSICERKRWAHEALAYNSIVLAWPEISKLAQALPRHKNGNLFEQE